MSVGMSGHLPHEQKTALTKVKIGKLNVEIFFSASLCVDLEFFTTNNVACLHG